MPGPEGGPGGNPHEQKPFEDPQQAKNPLEVDVNEMLRRAQQQEPTKGGEVELYRGPKPAKSTDTTHPDYNGRTGDIKGSLNPSNDYAPVPAPRRGHRRVTHSPSNAPVVTTTHPLVAPASKSGGPGGGAPVAVLDHPQPQPRPQTQTQTEAEVAPPPPGTTVEVPEPENGDPLRIVLASLDQNVDAFAREAAHEKMAQKLEGPWWKRAAQSAWHNITRELQLVKATGEARQQILEENNLLHHQGKDDTKWREATMDRYGSDYGEHLIHEGETFHKLHEAQSDPESQAKAERITNDLRDIGRKVARGEVDSDESLRMMIDRTREVWDEEGVSQDFIGEGQILAQNIAPKFRELEAMINSAEGLSAIDKEAMIEEQLAKLEVVAGEARVGSRTEIDSTMSERIAEKLRNVPFLNEGRIAAVTSALCNETVIAAMMSGVVYLGKRGASIAGKIVAPGIGAGVVAAIRERNALIDERALEARRDDSGTERPEVPDANRGGNIRRGLRKIGIGRSSEEYRAEVKATQYESRPVGELLDGLGQFYNESGELNITDAEGLNRAMSMMGEVRARIQIGDRTGARLINYFDISAEEMEQRRFDLDLAMAKLETDLQKTYNNPVAQAMLDIQPEDFARMSDEQREISNGMLMGEMKAKDRLFNKLVVKRAFKRALAATLMGGVIGAVYHYGAEAARDAFTYARETFTNLFTPNGSGGATLGGVNLEAFQTPDGGSNGTPTPDHIGGQATPDHVGGTGVVPTPDHVGGHGIPTPDHIGGHEGVDTTESTQISETSKLNLPQGYNAAVGKDGSLTLTAPDGKEYADLRLKPDGSLSQEAIQALKAHGFEVNDHQEIVQGKPEITHSEVSARQFVENHQDEMKTIHHTKWFDNNTAKFDLNELKLDNRLDANGNLIVDIRGMTAGGSFHGASGVDWHEAAKDGHLKVYLSASEGTQSQAFEVTIKPDGTAVIDKDSPAMSLFNSQGKFIGGFQEVALNGGEMADGSEKIATLATVVGGHTDSLTDTIKTPTLETAHSYTITPPVQPTAYNVPPPDNVFPFVPVAGRRRIGGERRRPESGPPTGLEGGDLAPVIPLPLRGPEGSEAPAAPAASSLRSPARNLAAERLADERGLPESGQLALESREGAEARAASEGGRSNRENNNFTAAEAAYVRQIDAEDREFPSQLDKGMLDGLLARERKLVTRLAYDAMQANPPIGNENPAIYTRRLLRVLHDGAERGRAERLPMMSPTMRAIAAKAFQALTGGRMAGGGGSSAGTRGQAA